MRVCVHVYGHMMNLLHTSELMKSFDTYLCNFRCGGSSDKNFSGRANATHYLSNAGRRPQLRFPVTSKISMLDYIAVNSWAAVTIYKINSILCTVY